MLGRLRRRLARSTARVRGTVGYWWLEQTDGWRGEHHWRRRIGRPFRHAGTSLADSWSDLTAGVARRARRLRRRRHGPGRPVRARRFGTAVRRGGPGRPVRARRFRTTVRRVGSGTLGGLRAVGTGTTRGLRAVGAGTSRRVRATVVRTGRGLRGLGTGTTRALRTVGTGTTRGLRTVGTGTGHGAATLSRATGRAFSGLRSGAARGGRALGSATRTGATRIRDAARTVPTVLTPRRLVAAAVVVAAAGALVASARLPSGRDRGVADEPGAQPVDQQVDPGAVGSAAGPEGPGLTTPGIHLSVRPLGSGDIAVVERVIVPEPIDVLPVSAPPSAGSDGPTARLTGLEVVADQGAVPVAAADIGQARDLTLAEPATTFELRYLLVDADRRSAAAPPGRATLSLRPAASGAVPESPAVVEVRGAVVHTLVCPDEPLSRRLCGIDDADGWYTEPVSAGAANVVALVDLPATEGRA